MPGGLNIGEVLPGAPEEPRTPEGEFDYERGAEYLEEVDVAQRGYLCQDFFLQFCPPMS